MRNQAHRAPALDKINRALIWIQAAKYATHNLSALLVLHQNLRRKS
jgi:hypothetical protein